MTLYICVTIVLIVALLACKKITVHHTIIMNVKDANISVLGGEVNENDKDE